MGMYTVGSLFSGIGGIDLAFNQAGFDIRWQVEIDDYCNKILERHWPGVQREKDVRERHSVSYLDSLVRTWYNPLNGNEYTEEEKNMAGKLKKLTPEQAETCVKMYEAGLSLQPIAEYFGVSRQSMWDLLRRRTTMRPKLRYGEENHFYRGGETADDQAQNMVEHAIRAGSMEKKDTCEQCGSQERFKDGRSAVQAHHCDYNKPLEVMWLCQKCHHEWHKNHEAKKKEVQAELPSVDVLVGGFP